MSIIVYVLSSSIYVMQENILKDLTTIKLHKKYFEYKGIFYKIDEIFALEKIVISSNIIEIITAQGSLSSRSVVHAETTHNVRKHLLQENVGYFLDSSLQTK